MRCHGGGHSSCGSVFYQAHPHMARHCSKGDINMTVIRHCHVMSIHVSTPPDILVGDGAFCACAIYESHYGYYVYGL